MADDPTDPPAPPAKDDPSTDDTLGDAGKAALRKERERAKAAEKALSDMQAKLTALEDKDKSETEKLREQVAQLTTQVGEKATAAMRTQVALEKGLTAAQAKRLVGGTEEELLADADDILATFPTSGGATSPPSRGPKTALRGGGDPTEEPVETNPAKLAESVPRL